MLEATKKADIGYNPAFSPSVTRILPAPASPSKSRPLPPRKTPPRNKSMSESVGDMLSSIFSPAPPKSVENPAIADSNRRHMSAAFEKWETATQDFGDETQQRHHNIQPQPTLVA